MTCDSQWEHTAPMAAAPIPMKLAEFGQLPATLDTPAAARLLGVSTDLLYRLVREGGCPVEPLRLGRAIRWPTLRLVEVVGAEAVAELVGDQNGGDGGDA